MGIYIANVTLYIDDILISTDTKTEHDETLRKLMQRARDLNIKFNAEKLQYCVNEVKYVGFLFNKNNIKPDLKRIEAITNLKEPTNVKELQRVLGMINYLRCFIPNLAEVCKDLRELLKKNVEWQRSHNHKQAFENIKTLIAEATVVNKFDLNKALEIQCDASKDAIVGCLLQDKKPISFFFKIIE